MARVISPEEATWVPHPKDPRHRFGNYLGDFRAKERGPQAFLNEHGEDDAKVEPHFHVVDQFQIFVRGGGTIGKSELEPVLVHYVDAFTPYGPIIGGPEGFSYFNLRATADIDAHWMPGSKEEMPRRAGRHRTAHVQTVDPAAEESTRRTVLIEPEDDGLCAFDTVVAPGRKIPDDVAGGSGRYELVLAGSLKVGDAEFPADSLIFAAPGEQLPTRCAGDDGAHVLTVQAPAI